MSHTHTQSHSHLHIVRKENLKFKLKLSKRVKIGIDIMTLFLVFSHENVRYSNLKPHLFDVLKVAIYSNKRAIPFFSSF